MLEIKELNAKSIEPIIAFDNCSSPGLQKARFGT